MTAQWFERWVFAVVLCVVVAFAAAGWLRPHGVGAIDEAHARAAVRSYFQGGNYHVSFFQMNTTDGRVANVTMRVDEFMPSAGQFNATFGYGWYLKRLDPFNEPQPGPG